MPSDSEPLSPNAILRFPEARKRGLIPYSKSQWYYLMRQRDENNEPLAPLPIPLAGGGAVGLARGGPLRLGCAASRASWRED